MQAGFDRAKRHGGDGGDFIEGKVLQHVEEQGRTLRGVQLREEGEPFVGRLAPKEERARVGCARVGPVGRSVWIALGRNGSENISLTTDAAELLQAFLVGDAKEPRGEAAVVAQAGDVTDGSGEGLLHDVKRGVVVTEQLGGIGVERQLVPLEEGVPGVRVMLAGGGKEMGIGRSHDEAIQGRMPAVVKGSMKQETFIAPGRGHAPGPPSAHPSRTSARGKTSLAMICLLTNYCRDVGPSHP